jgi:hypothetical protein
MKINGIDGLTISQLQDEVNRGGKFVVYRFCISAVVVTFRRSSGIYFIKSDQSRVAKGLPWSLVTMVAGWWGLPWGVIYTIGSLGTNFGGGKNVTDDVMRLIHSQTGGPVFDFETKDIPPSN